METVTSNHCQDIMLRLNNDRKASAKYCDITLVVDDHKFPAHKSVLGLLSTFFDKMFHIDMKENHENEAEINGVSKEVLEVILDFIYTGKITLCMENVFAVIEAAHFMDLPYVKETCTKYLGNQVNAGNWLSIRAYAKRYDYKELLDKVDELVTGLFLIVLKSESLVKVEVEELIHLLRLGNENLDADDEVYKAVIGWIKHDFIGRERYVGELLSFINFSKLSLVYLKEVVIKEKLIENSLSCTRDVLNAITNHPGTDNQIAEVPPLDSFVAVDGNSVFKFGSGKVKKQAHLSYNHYGGSACINDSVLYVIGGFDTNEIEEFNFKNEVVQNLGSPLHQRCGAASIVIDRKLFVTGGLYAESSAETGFLLLDEYRKLSSLDQMNFNRHSHALVSTMGSIYVVGGDADVSRSLLRFNLQYYKMSVLPPMKCKRIGLAAVLYKREIYAISGSPEHGGSSSTVENFNLFRNGWKSVASLNVARFRPGACVIKNRLVVVGGGSGKIEVYDEEKDKWNIVGECEDLKDVFAAFPCSSPS